MSESEIVYSEVTNDLECPLRYIQNVLGGKWKLPIICMLSDGQSLRNATIKRRLGDITNSMLSQTLKEMQGSGLINRKQFNEVPPHVEYSLTEKGQALLPIMQNLYCWAVDDMQQTGCTAACETCSSMH